MLLKAGMTVRQAILYNVLSAMMAYLGMITGILIGHYAENISTWIFALTAGFFMYVALVDMVSQTHCVRTCETKRPSGLQSQLCKCVFVCVSDKVHFPLFQGLRINFLFTSAS